MAIAVLQRTRNAAFAAEEFFKASINNEHTRRAYGRIVGEFLSWCNKRKVELINVTPAFRHEWQAKVASALESIAIPPDRYAEYPFLST